MSKNILVIILISIFLFSACSSGSDKTAKKEANDRIALKLERETKSLKRSDVETSSVENPANQQTTAK